MYKKSASIRRSFDPVDLDISITPFTVMTKMRRLLKKEDDHGDDEDEELKSDESKSSKSSDKGVDYMTILLMSLKLNDDWLIGKAMECIPIDFIPLVVKSMPLRYLPRIMDLSANHIGQSQYLEFYLLWIKSILTIHGTYLKENFTDYMASLKLISEQSARLYRHLKPICDGNCDKMNLLISMMSDLLDADGTGESKKLRLKFEEIKVEPVAIVPHGKFAPIPFIGSLDDE